MESWHNSLIIIIVFYNKKSQASNILRDTQYQVMRLIVPYTVCSINMLLNGAFLLITSITCAFFERKINEPFRLKIISNLTHGFYDNFNKTFRNYSFDKIVIKTHISNSIHFQDEIARLIFI